MNDFGILYRLTRLEIRGFRGFVRQATYDLDADLVLLLGPNGAGKTSLIEALQLVLTGVPVTRERGGRETDGFASLFALAPDPSAGTPSGRERRTPFRISARATLGAAAGQDPAAASPATLVVSGRLDGPEANPRDARLTHRLEGSDLVYPVEPLEERSVTADSSGKRAGPEVARALPTEEFSASRRWEGASLQARLTSFFQHDVGRLFDDAAEGKTIASLLFPVPVRLRLLQSLLDETSEALKKRKREEQQAPEPLQSSDRGDLEAYRTILDELLLLLHPVEPVDVALPEKGSAKELAHAVQGVLHSWGEVRVDLRDVPSRLRPAIERRMSTWRRKLEKLRGGAGGSSEQAAWKLELERVVNDEEELKRRRPNLEREAVAYLGRTKRVGRDELLLWRNTVRTVESREAVGRVGSRASASGEQVSPEPDRLAGESSMSVELPGLLPTLAFLADGLESWLETAGAGVGPRPAELLRELASIRLDALKAYASDLKDWAAELERDRLRLAQLQIRRAELRQLLEKAMGDPDELRRFDALVEKARNVPLAAWARAIEFEEWAADAEARDWRVQTLERLASEVARCGEDLLEGPSSASPEDLKQLADAINEVSGRFCIAGSPRVKVTTTERELVEPARDGESERSRAKTRLITLARLRYEDGRGLAELSSGQASQMAVAYLVAQNLLVAQGEPPLSRAMPHRVLLLDDVSSTYDLSNLVRESILWRQLAYTQDLDRKRQVILSSHHEDLTNLLLDHLVPPEGYSMRVLQFKGWSREKGSIVESFLVEPGRRHDDGVAAAAFSREVEVLLNGA